MKARASDIAAWTGGQLHGEDVLVQGVGCDSRQLPVGALFVALQGERVDGHDFVAALQHHAAAALVSRLQPVGLPQIVVADVEQALMQLAQAWLAQLPVTVLALTGSNGKTTVKTLLAAILARRGRTHATPGNLNNEIGLPLSVLGIQPEHEYAVLEMGCGKPGDIDQLAAIAPPDVALVNNVAAAHLERLHSVEGVAQAKAGIYRGLKPAGIAILNADDAQAALLAGQIGAHRQIRFGLTADAEVSAQIHSLSPTPRFQLHTPVGEAEVLLALPGLHNVRNALAAAAMALAVATPLATIVEGLQSVQGVGGRLRRLEHAGVHWYDDSYNANPGSLAAAIETLALEPGERWLVLGNMAELGPEAAQLHRQSGALARERGIERLWTVGELAAEAAAAFGPGATACADVQSLIEALRAALKPGLTVVVKGSRSARMERVVAALAAPGEGGH